MTLDLNKPLPGHYKRRLVKGGPFVPVHITRQCHCTPFGGPDNLAHEWSDNCDRYPPLMAWVNGEEADPYDIWSWCAKCPISAVEYKKMMLTKDWAETVPNAPEARPREAIDMFTAPPLF